MNDDDYNITSTTKYWIYTINFIQCKYLKELFQKRKLIISSSKKYEINDNDIILIYCKNVGKSGFISVCQTLYKMKKNNKNMKIFDDDNFNKYHVNLKIVLFFDNFYKLSEIKHDKMNEIKKKYIKDNLQFEMIPKDIGKMIYQKLIELDNKFDDSDNYNKLDTIDTDIVEDSDSDIDINDKFEGHVPILMIPCLEFKWNANLLRNFYEHYKICEKCLKIDNNETSVLPIITRAKLDCVELTEEMAINKYLKYYFELKKYNFNDNNTVYLIRINKRGHLYHKCVLIVW